MQERKEQEFPVRACSEQGDDPFRLWAESLSDALGETIAVEGPDNITGKVSHRNGGSSKVAKTAIALAAEDDRQPRDIEAEQDWLGATRRRVRLENERLLLKQEAMRQALEELGRLHSAVEARRTKANGGPHRSEVPDETAIWLYAENESTHQTKAAVQTARRDDEPGSAPKANQQIQLWSSQLTPRVPDSNNVQIRPPARTLRMLLPNPQHQEASVGRATLFLDKWKGRIIRYRRLLSR